MSIEEARTPGAVRRVAIAVTHGDAPVGSEEQLDEERVALELRVAPILRD